MMELIVGKLRACFFSWSCKGDPRSRFGGAKYFVPTDLNLNGAFFTQLRGQKLGKFITTKESVNKRKGDWFGTPTWPPFYCFGTDQYCKLDFRC